MHLLAQVDFDEAVLALRKLDVESLLLPFLLQLALILLAARAFGVLARRVGQPSVIGEIIAGIVLGPTVLGALAPEVFRWFFHPSMEDVPDVLSRATFSKIFTILSQIGLIFLLFLIGLEFDFAHVTVKLGPAFLICMVGIAVPFAIGFLLAPVLHPHLEPHPEKGVVSLFGMRVFLATALCITALPVLGRMLLEMGIQRTKLAATVIAAAALGDAVGWILLATVSSMAKAKFEVADTLRMFGLTVGFFAGMFFLVRPIAIRYIRAALAANGDQLSLNAMTALVVTLLLAAIATNLIGIFAIFGAFALGAVLSDQEKFREAVSSRMSDFTNAFFLPIFFTYTGLRTDIGALNSLNHWLICAAVLVAAIVGKLGGCGVAARMVGFTWKEAGIVGAFMNTRGLMELIVINVGYDLGVIPKSLFGMLVIMAVVTTCMASPIVLRLRHGTELDEPLRQAGFGSPAKSM